MNVRGAWAAGEPRQAAAAAEAGGEGPRAQSEGINKKQIRGDLLPEPLIRLELTTCALRMRRSTD